MSRGLAHITTSSEPRLLLDITVTTEFEVIPALPEHEPILARILELYIYDFSDFLEVELHEDGRFEYPHLHLYWEENGRYPFLVKVNGRWAGFVFVRRGSQIHESVDVWDMAEFFIMRKYRRLGVGMRVAQEIWRRFPGKWEVRIMDLNERAKPFWSRAIGGFLGEPNRPTRLDKNGRVWLVHSFESRTDQTASAVTDDE